MHVSLSCIFIYETSPLSYEISYDHIIWNFFIIFILNLTSNDKAEENCCNTLFMNKIKDFPSYIDDSS